MTHSLSCARWPIRFAARMLLCCFVALGSSQVFAQHTDGPVLLFAPETNLERSELDVLETARVSVDVAMYSFTDRELAEELGRLARRGVHVRVYRDRSEYAHEEQRGLSVVSMLLSAGVEVRIKGANDLMHLKSYAVDGTVLRTGSANWSPTGLKRQDNDIRYDNDPTLARLFLVRFGEMWERPGNTAPTLESR